MTVAIVIGTGRSGTSLAMQALSALRLPIVGSPVPAGENNLRGTGEAIEFRDAMVHLHKELGNPTGFLPDDWRNSPAADKAREWLTGYLRTGALADAPQNFAMKFPLSSLFLPLIEAAAKDAGVRPVWLWATRSPSDVIASLMRSYRRDIKQSTALWAQRTFYLLRDAPVDTWLLPFEAWYGDPDAQVGYLASAVGCKNASQVAAGRACFSAALDHAKAFAPSVPAEAQSAVDAIASMMVGRRGRLGDFVDRNSLEFADILKGLGDTMTELVPSTCITQDEIALRLATLNRFKSEPGKELEMKEELEVLSDRIRDVAAENAKLRRRSDADQREEQEQGAPAAGAAPSATEELVLLHEKQVSQQAEEIDKLKNALAEVRLAEERQSELLLEEKAKYEALLQSYRTLAQRRDDIEESVETYHRAKLSSAEMRANRFERLSQQREAEMERLRQQLKEAQPRPVSASSDSAVDQNRALAAHLKSLEQELVQVRAQLTASEEARGRMLGSNSWRITAPLRGLRRYATSAN